MGILERLMKSESLRTRVFVPLMFALLLLLCSMALILQQSQEKVLDQELAARTAEAERLFLEHLKEETHQLSLALHALTLNPELLAALKAADRKQLQALTQPYFERLRADHHIPLLNFTGSDRTNILRLHQPDLYGDRIDRFTALQAEKTGKEAAGIELDPLGTTTLRVVSVWHDEKNLLGYVEAGMEIEHILLELEEVLGNRVYTFVDKAFVERKDWEENLRLRGHPAEWGRFPETVSSGAPLGQLPEKVAQLLAGNEPVQPATDLEINGAYYRAAFIPLIDAGQRKIGHFSILFDTTTRVAAFHRSILFVVLFYLLIGTALSTFFYVFLGQLEAKQRRLEAARLEFERGFRHIFDNASDGILLAESETKKFSLGNAMVCRMLGYGPEEITTLGVADIHPARDLPRVIDQFERQQRREFAVAENLPVQRKDGSIFFADISSYPVTLGGKSYQVGIFRDITERTKAEERLRESEERYRSIFEYANDIIYLLNPDGTYRSLNPAFEKITGWAVEEWIDKPFAPLVHPDDLPYANDIFQKTLAGESLPTFALRLARKSGEYFAADLSITPLVRDGIAGAVAIVRDVTERKRMEEALASAAEFSRIVMDSIDDAISIVDVSDYRIIGCNAGFLKKIGLSREDVLGRRCYELTHHQPEPCSPPFDLCPLLETVTTGNYAVAEHTHFQKNGDKYFAEVSTSPIFDANGAVVKVVHVARDITERKRTEEKIRRLNDELELQVEERTQQLLEVQEELVRKEKLSVLGQLSGSLGHELRNPLGVISNAVYFLKMVHADADATTREYLDIIKKEIDNSLRIITDLLDFARTKPPHRAMITAAAVVQQSLEHCSIPENVSIIVDLPDGLPRLNVDPPQLGQVLTNFITNGVQAMPKGGTLRVAARQILNSESRIMNSDAKSDGDFVALSVTDSGEGITPENMTKLFQPLFTTKARGIGLGLVVCKNLVEANGGRIEVESEAGKGTTFMMILPTERDKI